MSAAFGQWISVVVGLSLMFASTVARGADAKGNLKFQVQLIWGTNGDKPNGKELKEVDKTLVERLKGVFKWNNYFEVNRKEVMATAQGTPRTKLSDKCEVEIKNLGESKIEISLWGQGTCVKRVTKPVTPGNLIVLAGDDKNDTAWFVVLNPQ